MNPIQQLVDAAKGAVMQLGWQGTGDNISQFYCERCSQGGVDDSDDIAHLADCPIPILRAAIAAVESAQVETRWEVQSKSDPEWKWSNATQQAAQLQKDSLGDDFRVVRIDTYRSVESDHK